MLSFASESTLGNKGGDKVDIAAYSIANSLMQTQNEVGISILKKAMDSAEAANLNLLSMLVPPSSTLGTNVDISA
ncbi:hypothetical protein PIPA1_14820 [Pelosinus sp. IPA-1]|nr:hypothetical protein PIPA1_14820 [Pelosinus sp. IPA-1]